MKVLMFGWEFPPHISGGLGTACYGLTRGLVENHADVIFIVPKAFGDEDTEGFRLLAAEDVPVHYKTQVYESFIQKMTFWGVNSIIVPYLGEEEFRMYSEEKVAVINSKREDSFTTNYTFTGKYGKDLMTEVSHYAIVSGEIARMSEFDVIHAHDWLSFSCGIIAKQISGKPLVVHIHATEFDRSGNNINQLVFELEQRGMQAADKVITVSDLTRQIVIEKYGIEPNKVVTVHNAIEDKDEQPRPAEKYEFKEKIVTYLGRVTQQKGPEYFVEAAAKVLKKDKNFRFVMAGTGDMLQRMIKLVAKYRISANFHFTGFLKGDDVDKLFAMSDVYVMPSVSEPFGISSLEALRSDVPIIISKQSGISEVLKHAIKVDFWDIDEMANSIYAVATFKGLSNILVKEGKKELKNLKWGIQAKKVLDIYDEVVKTASQSNL